MNQEKLFTTDRPGAGAASLVLRVTVGVVLFAHGAQKMFGWFDGHGYSWTLEAWSKWFGFPEGLTHLVIWGEFLAPVFLLIGLFTRLAATVVALIMAGAIAVVHAPSGFFMNWYGESRQGEGFEYHLLVIGIAVSVVLLGGRRWSLDHVLENRKTHAPAPAAGKAVSVEGSRPVG